MEVYFSGTDWSELEDNSPHHNFYLSLIVNNFMDFCAKVAFIAKPDELSAKDEKGGSYKIKINETTSGDKLMTYDCTIKSPSVGIVVEDKFNDNVKYIIDEAEKRPVVNTTISKKVTYVKSDDLPIF